MDEATRLAVIERAADRCEYCRLPVAHVLTPFQVDHIIAKKHRGMDDLSNLAYACLRCNLHKQTDLTGIDERTKKLTKLFHHRRHKWERHFRFDGPRLVGRTAVGRTTVQVLAMNDADRVALRAELIHQGLMAEE
jgi:hypothetical protein